ncbi:MAG: MerR family DNA-binding protein [Bryobacteraceae bacterium]|nr:MerR family DNA-binding protein [Bryobacteraceae bacterium]
MHVETIRYYERLGLIPRPEARSGFRQYPQATVERIRSIKRAQDFGFSLREINELYAITATSDSSRQAMCAKVEEKVREIETRIAALVELRATNCKAW